MDRLAIQKLGKASYQELWIPPIYRSIYKSVLLVAFLGAATNP